MRRRILSESVSANCASLSPSRNVNESEKLNVNENETGNKSQNPTPTETPGDVWLVSPLGWPSIGGIQIPR